MIKILQSSAVFGPLSIYVLHRVAITILEEAKKISQRPLCGSSSSLGALNRRGLNPNKLAYNDKLTGWPAPLTASAF